MGKISVDKNYRFDKVEELVERKGIGHPDTICDAIAEKASQLYSSYFMKSYGRVAHHWFDKVMLIGGASDIAYGRGELLIPYKVIFAGKCVKKVGIVEVPILHIFEEACNTVLSRVLTGFNINRDLVVVDETVDYHGAGRKSKRYMPKKIEDLVVIDVESFVSNDCNLLSAHYPLTFLENLVLELEHYINGAEFKLLFSESGWDVKIVGVKNKGYFELILNIPILASRVANHSEYSKLVSKIKKHLENHCLKTYRYKIILIVNPQDCTGQPYLTSLGSAADTGDVGVVGRGNRINGLITPMKSMSIEAPSGKNPIDHTGKIYGVLCTNLARAIYYEFSTPVEVHIYTYKEVPLLDPTKIIIDFDENGLDKLANDRVKDKITKICEREIKIGVPKIIDKFIKEGIIMW
ncbi:methionine adenosyltransferase [Listeria booriae]|uniref:methionine adenosyltransferase n=1 Tax=Listeria booriae TaxID=1552123 RepID=UPI001624AE8D|nr:methionine adenosyltransferase [Listeria booriae]MBC1512045.1 S-adenosylmethionine synthetase [Listeria booriae]MBC6150843.1 S-adenosylmethionine synthetase [Listeria booriae]MBC6305091.1 S-adenosylmethionine synthetase [Listeria booriae]